MGFSFPTASTLLNLQKAVMSPYGVDTSEINALIESGLAVCNMTVVQIVPSLP